MKIRNKRVTKRKLKRRANTRKRGGGGNLSSMTATVLFTFLTFALANSNGKHYYMTACAGNTCRSPQAEYMIKSLVDDPNLVSSFGVNVRAPGSSMAPLTKQIATDLCQDNETCIESVNDHKSKQFDYALVKHILENPNNTLQILPMDDKTADSVFDILQKYDFDDSELSRIHVGADCNKNGECSIKSANAPDPYFDKGTWREPGSYANASSTIANFIENQVMYKTPSNPQKWIPDGNNIQRITRYPNKRKQKNSGR
jgi:protein-tyrosine-phosphatase